MITVIFVSVAAWVMLTLVGIALCAVLPPAARTTILPAAPLLGVVLAVVVLHYATMVTSVGWGVLALGLVTMALVARWTRLPDRRWELSRRSLTFALALPVLAGFIPYGLALAPNLTQDGAMILPSPNHDGYYYVALTEWLKEERGTREPQIGTAPESGQDTPFDATAERHVQQNLRLGESLTQAAISVLLSTEAEQSWYAINAMWLLLFPAGILGFTRLARVSDRHAFMIATVATASPLLLRQVYNQNSHSLLGVALAPLALAMVADGLSRRPQLPVWMPALTVAAWLGTYTEYAVLAAPTFAALLLARPVSDYLRACRRAAAMLALALLFAPLVWYNAVKSLLFLGSLTAGTLPSAFLGDPRRSLSRITGATPITTPETETLVPLLLTLLLLVGLLGLAMLRRMRALIVLLTSTSLAAVAYYSFIDVRPYTQQRTIEIAFPLVVVAAGAGWSAIVSRLRGHPPLQRQVAAGAAAVAALAWALVGLHTNVALARQAVANPRPVDQSFETAAKWIRELSEENGRDVAVLTNDFFNQLWLTEALRDQSGVAYPILAPDYMVRTTHWAGDLDDLLLVDSTVFVDTDPEAVVRQNERFRLIDTRIAAVVVATPQGIYEGLWQGIEPGPGVWMIDNGQLIVLHNRATEGNVLLSLQANPDLGVVPVDIVAGSTLVSTLVPVVPPVSVPVPLPIDGGVTILELRNGIAAAPVQSVGDPRRLSVRVVDVARAAGG